MIAYLCAIGIVALIYCLLALGLNLQFGLTRLVNFGVVAFFAVGAYTSGLLALQGVPLVLCFVAAGVLAGLLALPIGYILINFVYQTGKKGLMRFGIKNMFALFVILVTLFFAIWFRFNHMNNIFSCKTLLFPAETPCVNIKATSN